MEFVKLTSSQNKECYINIDTIDSMVEKPGPADIRSDYTLINTDNGLTFDVKESPRIIASKIKDVDKDSLIVTKYLDEQQIDSLTLIMIDDLFGEPTEGMGHDVQTDKIKTILTTYVSMLVSNDDGES